MARFSKATVAAEIQGRIEAIQARRNFDPGNGTSQLSGRSDDAKIDYGRFHVLLALAMELDLNVSISHDPRKRLIEL